MFSYDKKFIQKLIQKDNQTFTTFYLETVDVFFRYIKATYSIRQAESEDIIASFYAKIRDILPSYKEKYPFESYIRLIFKNMIKDHFKKSNETYFSSFKRDDEETNFEDTLINEEISLDDFLQQKYQGNYIEKALEQIDQEGRDIIFWKFIEDKSYETIATLLGTNIINVRQKMSRTIKKLQKILTCTHLK